MWIIISEIRHNNRLELQGGVVIRSDTKPALDLIITRLRVILKIVWPYKHPFAALKKWPLDLINTHLRSSKKKSDLITAQMRKKTFCANRIFFNQKYFLTNSLGWKSVTLNPQMRQTLFAKIVFSQKSVTHTVLAIPRNLFSHPEKSGHSITTESKPEKGYIFKNNI